MDGARRLARSLISWLDEAAEKAFLRARSRAIGWYRTRLAENRATSNEPYARPSTLDIVLRRLSVRIANLRVPRGAGLAATAALFLFTGMFGANRGDHWPAIRSGLVSLGDDMANAAGLRVIAVRLSGNRQLHHEDVMTLAGIGERTSVLFFDPLSARDRLRASPWVADATIQKLYPNELMVSIVEREPFARWQRNGQIVVIAQDGAVIMPHVDARFTTLPLVVGQGAELRAREIVAHLADHPALAAQVHGASLVGQRRWTLVMKNGIDVLLPDADLGAALAALSRLDAEKSLLSRDVSAIDLRVRGRVSVRLSDDAHRAHEATIRERQKARRRGTDT
jgi:cell division protein FtsQ